MQLLSRITIGRLAITAGFLALAVLLPLTAVGAAKTKYNSAILTVAGIRLGVDTDATVVHRYGRGLRTRSHQSGSSPAWSKRYYVDTKRRITICVVSETDTINLVEIRSGVHVPKPSRARLARAASGKFANQAASVAGLTLGSTRGEVLKHLGAPTTDARHPGGISLYYEKTGGSVQLPQQAYAAAFKFKSGRLVYIIVYSGEFM